MSRPCNCGECRLCFLADNDARYRALWGIDTPRPSCRHLGQESGRQVQCDTCAGGVRVKLRRCAVHQQCSERKPLPGIACCTTCPDYSAAAGPLWTRTIDFGHGSQSGLAFNCGIIEWRGRLLLFFRHRWGGSCIRCAELDPDTLQPRSVWPVWIQPTNQDRLGQEDPRPFFHDGSLHLMYVGVEQVTDGIVANVCLARLADDACHAVESWMPRYDARRPWEKNWSMFTDGGHLHAVYSIQPHRVLRLESHDVGTVWLHDAHLSFPWGEMRGGACPVFHRGEWYHWFHSQAPHSSGYYTVALYTFAAVAPFRPLRWIPRPLIVPDAAARPGPGVATVVFPGGALRRGDEWWVSYGYYDCWCMVAAFSATEIEESLEVLP